MPYITEEIYQSKFRKLEKTKSIHITKYTEYNQELVNKEIERKAQTLIDLIAIIRKEKSSKGYSLKKEIRNLTISADKNVIEDISDFLEDLKAIGNISFIGFGNFTLSDQNIITINPSLKIKIEF